MRSFVAALSAAFLAGSAAISFAKPVPINGFAAKVNGSVITRSELEDSMRFTRMAYERMPPSAEQKKLLDSLRKDTLESLIDRELILSEFEKRGGVVKPEMIDDDINTIIREDFEGDRAKLLAELKRQGTTLEKFREMQEKRIAVRYMRSSEIGAIPVATPKAIQKFYDDNQELFREPGFIRLRTITMAKATPDGDTEGPKKLVGEIHKKLKDGADFGTLAKTYSLDSAAEKGGDRGTIGHDTQDLRPDLVALAFAQETGEVSEVREDQAFYYILKVESRELGKRAPLSDPKVRDAIEKRLMGEQRQEAQDRWLQRLKKTAIIKRYQ